LIIVSKRIGHGVSSSNLMNIMFFIFVFPVESGHAHCPWIIWVSVACDSPQPVVVEVMRSPSPLRVLVSINLLHNHSPNRVFHTHTRDFLVLQRLTDPGARDHITIEEVDNVENSNHYDPHSEPTV
jgi:hypothetical protein